MIGTVERAVEGELARQGLPATAGGPLAAYVGLLARWSARIRLTASHDPEVLVQRHLADAVAARRLLGERGGAMIDVGSGGGLPALPLALLLPGLTLRLVEANQRKCAFLRTAVAELSLGDRVVVTCGRVEALDGGGAYDLACSRATWSPERWLEVGASLVRSGGEVLVFAARRGSLPAEGGGASVLDYALLDGTPRVVALYGARDVGGQSPRCRGGKLLDSERR